MNEAHRQPAWGDLIAGHRDRLRRMVAMRLDPRLKSRVDPSDVVQEALLEAATRHEDYVSQEQPMPLFLWLRFLTGQRILILHRRHLGTEARDVEREVSIHRGVIPGASSAAIAAQLLGRDTDASERFRLAERRLRVQEALERLDPMDREILAMRHFEQLSNSECARVLGIQESACTKRYMRALRRLRQVLACLPGGLSELLP